MALQRNAELRAEWKVHLTEWRPEQLIFLDESAANEKTGDRKYRWAPIGAIASSHELLKYTEKWSILPLYTMDGYISWDIIQGSYNIELFNKFVKNHVIPRTTPFPGPRSVLIMDNCAIHRAKDNPVVLLLATKLLMIGSHCDVRGCRNSARIFTTIFT